MYIKRIELTNIKKYEYKEIEFKPGLNFISGRNGAGKTTIIESIGFALFDYSVSSKNFNSYFIRKGEKKGEVKIYITDKNGNDLVVDRKISMSSAGNSWSISKENESIAIVSGNVEVLNYIKENLEFYPDDNITEIYSNIISVPQGEFTQAFFYSEKPRRDVFDPIFKLDSYRKAYNNIKLLKNIEDEINEFMQNKALLLGEVKEYDEIVNSIKEKSKEIDEIKKDHKESEEIVKNIRTKYDALLKFKEKNENVKNEILKINVEYEKNLTLLETKKKYYDEIVNLKKEMESKKNDYDSYVTLENVIEKNEERIKELKEKKDLSEKRKQGIEKGEMMIEERNLSLSKQIQELEKDVQKIKENEKRLKELEDLKNNKTNEKGVNGNESNDKNDDKTKSSKYEELKSVKEKFIENIYKLESIKKQLEMNLKMQAMPGKDMMYLNSAKKNIDLAKKISEGEAVRYLDSASENIERVVKSKSDEGNNNLLSTSELVNEKDKIEQFIINIYNKNIEEKIESVLDSNQIKENFITFFEKIEKNVNENAEEITKANLEYNHLVKVNEELNQENTKRKERIAKEKEEKERWEKGVIEYKEVVKKLEGDVKEYEELNKLIETDKVRLRNLKAAYELYVSNLKKIEDEKKVTYEISSISSNMEMIKKKIDEQNEILKDISKEYNDEEFEKTRNEYEMNNTKVQIIKEKLGHVEIILNELKEKKKHLEEVKEKIKVCEKDIKESKEALNIISKLRDVVKTAPDEISSMLIKNIGNRASEIYSDIALDSNRLVWENSYEIALYDYRDDKEIRKTFKELSGGEQMTAALAIRIAMLEILTKIKLGILDEPTVNMDTVRREKLAEIIGGISEKFTQLIVVSHDDTFENITQNVVTL